MNWEEEMAQLKSAGYLLKNLNVLTIEFVGGDTSDVYIATSMDDKIQGLSGLDFLDTDGMLFCFASDSYVPFSVKDMKLDISISFFDSEGKLIESVSAKAGDPSPVFCSNPPYRYVLECPDGLYGGADIKV